MVDHYYSGHALGVRLRVGSIIRARVRVRVRVQSGRCTRGGGRVVGYELQFLQWDSNGLTLGLSLATEMYTRSHSNGLAYGSTRGVSSSCGVPVVTSRYNGAAEILPHSWMIVSDPEDAEGCAEVLQRVRSLPNLGEECRAVAENHSMHSSFSQLFAVLLKGNL